jgi:hypothetical protein
LLRSMTQDAVLLETIWLSRRWLRYWDPGKWIEGKSEKAASGQIGAPILPRPL